MMPHHQLLSKSCAELREIKAQKDALIASIQRELNELNHETDFEKRIAQLEEAFSFKPVPGANVQVHAPLLVQIRDAIKAHHDVKNHEGYTAYALGALAKEDMEEKKPKMKHAHKEVPNLPYEPKPEPPKHRTIAHDYVGHLVVEKPVETLRDEYKQYDPMKSHWKPQLEKPPKPVTSETVHTMIHNVKHSDPVDRGNTAGIGNVIVLDDLPEEDPGIEFWKMLA